MSIAAVSSTSTYTTTDSQTSNTTQLSRLEQAQQLAASQTISADQDVRITLAGALADSHYESPLQQAWLGLDESLATGVALTPLGGPSTGDLAAAGSSLNTYLQLLPASSLYMSSYTTPSEKFLGDLKSLGAAISAGDLSIAQADFANAQADAPDLGSFSLAYDTGDTAGMAGLTSENAANMAGFLTSIGYTEENANVEANSFYLGSLTENVQTTTPQRVAQEQQASSQSVQVARIATGNIPTSNQLVATAESAMYKAYQTIFGADQFAEMDDKSRMYNLRDNALSQVLNELTGGESKGLGSTSVSSVAVTV